MAGRWQRHERARWSSHAEWGSEPWGGSASTRDRYEEWHGPGRWHGDGDRWHGDEDRWHGKEDRWHGDEDRWHGRCEWSPEGWHAGGSNSCWESVDKQREAWPEHAGWNQASRSESEQHAAPPARGSDYRSSPGDRTGKGADTWKDDPGHDAPKRDNLGEDPNMTKDHTKGGGKSMLHNGRKGLASLCNGTDSQKGTALHKDMDPMAGKCSQNSARTVTRNTCVVHDTKEGDMRSLARQGNVRSPDLQLAMVPADGLRPAKGKGKGKGKAPKKTPEERGFRQSHGGIYVRSARLRTALPVRPGLEIGNLERARDGPDPLPPGAADVEVLCNRQSILGNPFGMLARGGPGRAGRGAPKDESLRDPVCEAFERFLAAVLAPDAGGAREGPALRSAAGVGLPAGAVGQDWLRDFGGRSVEEFRGALAAVEELAAERRPQGPGRGVRLLCHCAPLRCHCLSLGRGAAPQGRPCGRSAAGRRPRARPSTAGGPVTAATRSSSGRKPAPRTAVAPHSSVCRAPPAARAARESCRWELGQDAPAP